MTEIEKLVERVASYFKKQVKNELSSRLASFYVVGSYAFGKISKQRPDINFLLIFDKFTTPDDYLIVGEICRALEKEFKNEVTIKIEFRPFRYIRPRYNNKVEVSVNPIIISVGEIKAMRGIIFNKWFTNGLKSTSRLIFGKDFLKTLKDQKISKEDIKKGAGFDLTFFSLPLSRAPAQYWKDELNLLLNESLTNAKNIAFFGIEAAMSEEELNRKAYIEYLKNKDKIVGFYQKRYGGKEAQMVKRVLEVRDQYLKYKNNPLVAKEMFSIALQLSNIVRQKVFSS